MGSGRLIVQDAMAHHADTQGERRVLLLDLAEAHVVLVDEDVDCCDLSLDGQNRFVVHGVLLVGSRISLYIIT